MRRFLLLFGLSLLRADVVLLFLFFLAFLSDPIFRSDGVTEGD